MQVMLKVFGWVVLAVLFLCPAGSGAGDVYAAEVSGRVIRNLVQDMGSDVAAMEQEFKRFSREREDLQSEMEHLSAKYQAGSDAMKKKYRAEAIIVATRLNNLNQGEVDSYLRTVQEFIPKLKKLATAIKDQKYKGFSGEESFKEYHKKVLDMEHNCAHILQNMKTIKGMDLTQIAAVENSMASQHAQRKIIFSQESRLSAASVDQAIASYDLTASQLISLNDLLEMEKTHLSQLSSLQLVSLLNERMSGVGSGGKFLADVGNGIGKDIDGRISTLDSMFSSDPGAGGGAVALSERNQSVLDDILAGTHRY